ncbi:hypothetical protein [Falsiroseomonas sp. CW058]|uniref:hypothetical protein n=1 Tax=Falsiroseomonas sp. CW058 TaxID=3388664 RepID=UPI003D31250E
MSTGRLTPEVAPIAARRAQVARQLDLMLEDRAPVEQVRRLLSDLDRISLDLARTLDGVRAPDQTASR